MRRPTSPLGPGVQRAGGRGPRARPRMSAETKRSQRAQLLTSQISDSLSNPQSEAVSRASPVETERSSSSVDVGRRDRLWGRQDLVLARIGQWADEDPVALQQLLADALLRRQVLDALTDLGVLPLPSETERASAFGTTSRERRSMT